MRNLNSRTPSPLVLVYNTALAFGPLIRGHLPSHAQDGTICSYSLLTPNISLFVFKGTGCIK
jgi:hypothetical protein